MSDPADEVTTDDEFEAALGDLIDAAVRNGVDLGGSWVYAGGDGGGDDRWEVMVHELEARDEAEE